MLKRQNRRCVCCVYRLQYTWNHYTHQITLAYEEYHIKLDFQQKTGEKSDNEAIYIVYTLDGTHSVLTNSEAMVTVSGPWVPPKKY